MIMGAGFREKHIKLQHQEFNTSARLSNDFK
jgi:hypothetical protein